MLKLTFHYLFSASIVITYSLKSIYVFIFCTICLSSSVKQIIKSNVLINRENIKVVMHKQIRLRIKCILCDKRPNKNLIKRGIPLSKHLDLKFPQFFWCHISEQWKNEKLAATSATISEEMWVKKLIELHCTYRIYFYGPRKMHYFLLPLLNWRSIAN